MSECEQVEERTIEKINFQKFAHFTILWPSRPASNVTTCRQQKCPETGRLSIDISHILHKLFLPLPSAVKRIYGTDRKAATVYC